MSKEIATVKTYTYTVYTREGCEVTDTATGIPLITAEPGKPNIFPAMGDSVTVSDDAAIIFKPVFNSALAALGLLGEGVTSSLPAGYIPCTFLEFDAASTFDSDVTVDDQTGFSFDCVRKAGSITTLNVVAGNYSRESVSNYVYVTLANKGILGISGSSGSYYPLKSGGWVSSADASAATQYNVNGARTVIEMNWLNNNKFSLNYNGETSQRDMPFRISASSLPLSIGNGATARPLVQAFSGSLYRVSVSQGAQKVRNYLPALSVEGKPVLYDLVKKKALTNSTDTAPIPAFTLKQARQLGKLSAGATCKILLPAGWQEDEGVVAAREQAIAKGCTLPVQEYTEGASASATYALRRIWVKRTLAANGAYVDAEGRCWNIDWCVDVWGADPESLGYERFRSVEAAVAYWELVPYEYPEEENLNLEQT